MSMRRFGLSFAAVVGAVVALPAPASAQWYVGGYIGGTHTGNATVSIHEAGLDLDFHDVHFSSRSTQPRRYYGLRLGRFGGAARRRGFEIEMIHMKAIADTSRVYTVTAAGGTSLLASLNSIAAAGLLADAPMNVVVGEFQMTHGLNLALFNVVVRRPLGPGGSGPVALMIRTGAGLAFPHAETTVFRAVAHHYEFGGPAGQGAVGIEVRLPYRLSAVAEYKLTYAHLGLTTAHGTASMSALSHHISVGVTFALTHQ